MLRIISDKSAAIIDPRLDELSNLLSAYSAIQKAIMQSKSGDQYIFSTENIVGEYAEILVCEKLNLIQEAPCHKAYDATDNLGRKYQIKSRWLGNSLTIKKNENSTEFGMIENDVLDDIDFIIVILFNSDFSVNYCYLMDRENYKLFGHHKKMKNKDGLALTPNIKKRKELDELGFNITNKIKN